MENRIARPFGITFGGASRPARPSATVVTTEPGSFAQGKEGFFPSAKTEQPRKTYQFSNGAKPQFTVSIDSLKPHMFRNVPGLTQKHARSLAHIVRHQRMRHALVIGDGPQIMAGILREIPRYNPSIQPGDIFYMPLGLDNAKRFPLEEDSFDRDLRAFAGKRKATGRPTVIAFQVPEGKKIKEDHLTSLSGLLRELPEFENLSVIFMASGEQCGNPKNKVREYGNFRLERLPDDLQTRMQSIRPEIDALSAHWNVKFSDNVLGYFIELCDELKDEQADMSFVLDHAEQMAGR